ncbi:MAG: transposase [Candidatus Parvarchaeota archaeon]
MRDTIYQKYYEQLGYDGITPVIPRSGNKYLKTIELKDLDYRKRWTVEHLFLRLKEMFGLVKNRFIGIKKVTIHIFSCLLTNLLEWVMILHLTRRLYVNTNFLSC